MVRCEFCRHLCDVNWEVSRANVLDVTLAFFSGRTVNIRHFVNVTSDTTAQWDFTPDVLRTWVSGLRGQPLTSMALTHTMLCKPIRMGNVE